MRLRTLVIALLATTAPAFAIAGPAEDRIAEVMAVARNGDFGVAAARLDAFGRSGGPGVAFAAAEAWMEGLPEAGPVRRPRPERALPLYKLVAGAPGDDQGNALFRLSELLSSPDEKQAALRQAAIVGYSRALRALSRKIVDATAPHLQVPPQAILLLEMASARQDFEAMIDHAALIKANRAKGDEDALAARAIAGLTAEADGGKASAMSDLAKIFEQGLVVPRDPEAAATWRRRAADAGHYGATMDLADEALGASPPDTATAVAIFRRLAEAGSADAALKIAEMRYERDAAEVTVEEADLWLDRAVAVEHVKALIFKARKVSDKKRAAALLAKAEAGWDGSANQALALADAFDMQGWAGFNSEKALLWYERAAADGGMRAFSKLGAHKLAKALTPAQVEEALADVQRAADMGSVESKVLLGDTYSQGSIGLAADPARALALYEEASARGSNSGKSRAAEMLYGDHGVPSDRDRAMALWREASAEGHLGAKTKLGRAMIDEAGGLANASREILREAVGLFVEAANAGNTSAMAQVADILMTDALGVQDFEEARRWLRRAADAGRTSALVALARSYVTTQNAEQAVSVYREAAALGSIDSMVELARAYSVGLGVERDVEKAQEWLTRATDAGGADPRTMELIARGYLTPDADAGDIKKGIDLLARAAELGNVRSALTLASFYEEGDVTPADPALAFKWSMRAAEGGSVTAMVKVGIAYGAGRGVGQDSVKAFEWFQRAIDTGSNSATALISIGRAFADGVGVERDTRRAFESFERAAGLGSVRAMELVARAYERGQGVEQRPDKAVDWFRRAAALGSTTALVELGRAYASGYGAAVDQERAYRYFRDAAARGSRYAMSEVGRFLLSGNAIAQDSEEALEWFIKAAEFGEVDAMVELAQIYRNGFSIPKDRERSIYWLERAIAGGSNTAKYQLALELMNDPAAARDDARIKRLLKESAAGGEARAKRMVKSMESAG